ncbi:cobalamin biosynthesis protein [Chamaesiphon sp. OTE_75_metabat_556]|uniref:cobalamin biosynthesis protein n=1 Tax=Chamaesiphon sp. OTE_75_metabat_556 TaxID=2964692 RepID=UPI00286A0126|nr:cobalamin biosynthesis protein [Chamaesiphon sp. OTE_75_metabat_556]
MDILVANVAPKDLWVGIGCQRGVSQLAIRRAIESVFAEYDLDLATIAGLATLDRKANEDGLLEYCRESGRFLKIYPPERLNSVMIVDSQLVSTLVGTASVASAAALCAAQTDILLVPKQKFRLDDESGWVTVAIARSHKNSKIIGRVTHELPLPTIFEFSDTI